MNSESQHFQSEIIKYLKDTLAEKLSKENQIDIAKKKHLRKIPFARKFIKFSRNDFEIQENFSIIPAKSNFYLSTKHSEDEIKGIIDHATKICKIAKYSKEVLKDCEDYFQMKLDFHAEQKSILTGRINAMFLGILAICFFFGAGLWIHTIKHSSFLEKISTAFIVGTGLIFISNLSKIVSDWMKPDIDEKYLNSTISYRYCILILKSAQNRINEQNEKTLRS